MERRKFSREFKLEVVKLVSERGASVEHAARDLEYFSAIANFERSLSRSPFDWLSTSFCQQRARRGRGGRRRCGHVSAAGRALHPRRLPTAGCGGLAALARKYDFH